MNLFFSKRAYADLDRIYAQIVDFIGEESAEAVIADIYSVLELALTQPEMGVPGLVAGTRELFPRAGKYRVAYEVIDDEIWVLAIALSEPILKFV